MPMAKRSMRSRFSTGWKVLGIYDAESTERYIMELMRVTPTAANVMEYVE